MDSENEQSQGVKRGNMACQGERVEGGESYGVEGEGRGATQGQGGEVKAAERTKEAAPGT